MTTDKVAGNDWIEYLQQMGYYDSYDGMCECYRCQEIRAEYFAWKKLKTQTEETLK